MKVCYVTQVLKQSINTKTTCSNYILKFRNRKSHLLEFYLGAWIETIIENHAC